MFSKLIEEKYICPVVVKKVRDYFSDDEHKRAFEEWYKNRYGKEYKKEDKHG